MTTDSTRARRSFLISAGKIGTAWPLLGAAGCSAGAGAEQPLTLATLAAAEMEVLRLAETGHTTAVSAFNWAQTLNHCAQSIEFSMTGFPQPKSRLFQRTAGTLAFAAFAWRGRMTHDLAEPIPGAPALPAQADPSQGLARLRSAMLGFQQWSAPLQPHFAYGELDKHQYEQAHAMHIANHLLAFAAGGAATPAG